MSEVWVHMPGIPALEKSRQDKQQFESRLYVDFQVSQSYRARFCPTATKGIRSNLK